MCVSQWMKCIHKCWCGFLKRVINIYKRNGGAYIKEKETWYMVNGFCDASIQFFGVNVSIVEVMDEV